MPNNCGLKIGANFITCVYTVNVGMCEAVYFKINTHVFFTYYELRLAKKTQSKQVLFKSGKSISVKRNR